MFDALKGLKDAITEKEKEFCSKRELTEERIDEINQTLRLLQKGSRVEIKYYCQNRKMYCLLTGTVEKIDSLLREIQVEQVKIVFSEIEEIRIR